MKKISKIYLFAVALFFLNIFFIGIDGVENVAKADVCGNAGGVCHQLTGVTCETLGDAFGSSSNGYYENKTTRLDLACASPNETCCMSVLNSSSDPTPTTAVGGSSLTYADCYYDGAFQGQYKVSADGKSCVLADSAATVMSCSECYSSCAALNDVGSAGYNGCLNATSECATCANTENLCNNACPDAECSSYGVCVGGVTQADCTSYGTGYIPNDSGTGCELPGNSDYAACMAVENDVAFCSRADSSLCSTNAECITDYGAGFVCDQATRTCEERGADVTVTTGSGDVCYTDSECNWYSKCKLGTNGATGICQGYLNFSDPQTTLNALGLPNGSTISPSGVVTAPNGTTTQLTPAQIVQAQAANGVTNGNTNVNYVPGPAQPKCGAGFRDVGGVCFPTNTGLSSASISDILMSLFEWLMGLFTTFAVLAFVISGIQYFMASGDESMAEKAKENATHAVIGIIIGLSGFIIFRAIAAALSGNIVNF